MNDPTPLPAIPASEAAHAHPDFDELARLKGEIADRDDILSLAAHELRNPLHALALHLALARTMAQGGSGADVAERIRRAELTLRRYSERVTVLMELLASPAAVYPLSPRRTDVAALLELLVESLDQEARSRRIEMRVVAGVDEAGRARLVDPVVLEQIVDNLLLNAFKHSGATLVTIRLQSEPGTWTVSVEDNGSGIALDDQQVIFEKFTVAAHSARGAGTGLGLWIVNRLVHAMDGEIGLASEPGRGCVFTVRIPDRDDKGQLR